MKMQRQEEVFCVAKIFLVNLTKNLNLVMLVWEMIVIKFSDWGQHWRRHVVA
jgi:hypothetical protein